MYNTRSFFIKQNSSLPEVKFPLSQRLREKYDITDDMMENVGITFSMRDIDTGEYIVANSEAKLIVVEDEYEKLDEEKYTLAYRLKINDTKRSGRFYGEFKLDFLGDYCGKITLPANHEIKINISESITKTSSFTPILQTFDDTFDLTFE